MSIEEGIGEWVTMRTSGKTNLFFDSVREASGRLTQLCDNASSSLRRCQC
jgi:hypothetical protein